MAEETYPQEFRYSVEHDWVRVEGDEAVFGVTWFAQDALGEIVYVEMPEAGTLTVGETPYGALESVKAITDVFAPLSGEVVATNELLADDPDLVNRDCYGDGWLVRIRYDSPGEIDGLMDADAYRTHLESA